MSHSLLGSAIIGMRLSNVNDESVEFLEFDNNSIGGCYGAFKGGFYGVVPAAIEPEGMAVHGDLRGLGLARDARGQTLEDRAIGRDLGARQCGPKLFEIHKHIA